MDSGTMNQNKRIRDYTLKRIPEWSTTPLLSFLATIDPATHKWETYRDACMKLLKQALTLGVASIGELTPHVFVSYLDPIKTWQFQGLSEFCTFLSLEYNCCKENLLCCSQRTIGRFIRGNSVFEELSTDNGYTIAEVVAAQEQERAYLQNTRYSHSPQKFFDEASNDLILFLSANDYKFTSELGFKWIEAVCECRKIHNKSWRRYISILCAILEGSELQRINERTYQTVGNKLAPSWIVDEVNMFLSERQQDGYSESTIRSYRCAILCFVNFLSHKGICEFEGITTETIKSFNIADKHKTLAGKNLYNGEIRFFLSFLALRGKVPSNLPMHLHSCNNLYHKPISILLDSQVAKIEAGIGEAGTLIEIEDAIIICLGLYLGLRSCDIVSLKLSDIDWDSQSISILQQKTKVFIRLPFPVILGNLITRYILSFRPESNSDTILVRRTAPYCRYSPARCIASLSRMLGEKAKGFHILRKTYASRLLKHGTGFDIITSALGHTTYANVDCYLEKDYENLRNCALDCGGGSNE
ncbi:MAG: site-specific integrase [Candidatus Cloacimonetes bacterium]|nr:site-specific integrase [Candidatus Cloacimonadota bacterium]